LAKNSQKSPPPDKPAKSGRPESSPPETLEKSVEREFDPVLSNLPRGQRDQIIARAIEIIKTEAFTGPLPHPRHLSDYDRILPGGADRILQMAEQTIRHNLAVSAKAQRDDQLYRLLGMLLGFSALILLVVAAVYAGLNGNNILAGLLLGTGVFSCVGVFVSAHARRD